MGKHGNISLLSASPERKSAGVPGVPGVPTEHRPEPQALWAASGWQPDLGQGRARKQGKQIGV